MEAYLNKYFIIPETIYIGGGNPGCVFYLLENLLYYLNKKLDLQVLKEFTVECNPVNVTDDFVHLVGKYNVSRISLGVQTFDESTLLQINRTKQNKQIIHRALNLLNAKKINTSIDLINGLPNVNYKAELQNLKFCLENYSQSLNHISFYDLTIDCNSYFFTHRNKFLFPNENDIWEFGEQVAALLKENNFINYEISNWMRNEKKSIHNCAYWDYQDYIGIGASAHGKIGYYKFENSSDIQAYVDNKNYKKIYRLTSKERIEEMLLMGLRTVYGVSKSSLEKECATKENFMKLMTVLANRNLLVEDEKRIILNDNGRLFLDSLLIDLFVILDKCDL